MIVTLPWPDAKLNPNRSKGTHWSSTSAARKKARADAFALTIQAMSIRTFMRPATSGLLALTITFVQPDNRARDRDNLLAALKPSLDGVADALGVNDSSFDPITIKREFGKKPGAVLVEIA